MMRLRAVWDRVASRKIVAEQHAPVLLGIVVLQRQDKQGQHLYLAQPRHRSVARRTPRQ